METKYVCLSFDDGPNLEKDNTMNNMLNLLEKHNVPASFFLIGNKITNENKKVIKRAVDMGCDIQNHSWTHPDMTKLTKEQIITEYQKCDNAISELTGKKAEFFRPPFICINDLMYDLIPTPFICGHGCEDWIPTVKAKERLRQMKMNAQNGTIFLLHVNEGNKETYKAVKKMIPWLKKNNFTIVNLPDLFAKLKVNPNKEKALWKNILE